MISLCYGPFEILLEHDTFPGLTFRDRANASGLGSSTVQYVIEADRNIDPEPFLQSCKSDDDVLFRDEPDTTTVVWDARVISIEWTTRRILYGTFPGTPHRISEETNAFAYIAGSITAHFGGFVVHTSAIHDTEAAYAFIGRSGAGKSSISHALCPPCSVIADDAAVVLPQQNGTWRILSLDTPSPGLPFLRRMFYLIKSSSAPALERADMREKLNMLYRCTYAPPRIPRFTDRHLENMLRFLADVDFGILRFSIDNYFKPELNKLIQDSIQDDSSQRISVIQEDACELHDI